jgi:hypothetical protein
MTALEKPPHIDILVKGDLPASNFHLQLIENDTADWNAKSEVIGVFHTNDVL